MLAKMSRWLHRLTPWNNEPVMPNPRYRVSPNRIPSAVREAPGKWVALKDGKVVSVRNTPDEVLMELHEKGISGASIMRSAGSEDVELVGLG